MNFSTTFTGQFPQNISDDFSWSNLQCNWDTFSFDDELSSRIKFSNENLQNLRMEAEQINICEVCENINTLDYLKNDFETTKAHNQQLLSNVKDVNNTFKEVKKNIALLTSKEQGLQKNIDNLEKESSLLATEHKHKKIAYQKALQKYSANFDMNVEVTDRSDISEEVIIKFGCPNSPHLKFVVDKNKRKIIKFESGGTLSKEEEEEACMKDCVPETLCKIRETICSKNVNNLL
nr:uncharacterized protein LOC111511877 [Leptinotarsa decemlineata]